MKTRDSRYWKSCMELIFLCLIFGQAVLSERIRFTGRQEWHVKDERFTIELFIESKYCSLDVQLNRHLLSKGYYEKYQSGETVDIIKRPKLHEIELCHYIGNIRSINNSWISINICKGIQGVIYDGKDLYNMSTVTESQSGHSVNSDQFEFIIENNGKFISEFSCGDGKGLFDVADGIQNNLETNIRSKREAPVPYNANSTSRFIELLLVIDNSFYKKINESSTLIRQRCKDIVNIVNSLYQHFNIFVALVGIEVWNDHDLIHVESDGHSTLNNFAKYAKIDEHVDSVQLITDVELFSISDKLNKTSLLGLSFIGSICSSTLSVGINRDTLQSVEYIASIMAHELAHSMGIDHDNENVSCPSTYCIMWPIAEGSLTWSFDTIKNMSLILDKNKYSCLNNKPISLFDGPVCGNSFTEYGEECDCGLVAACDNPCCNATTCKFHPNASCAAGECCDLHTCEIHPIGTICREASLNSSSPRYCSGSSEHCLEWVSDGSSFLGFSTPSLWLSMIVLQLAIILSLFFYFYVCRKPYSLFTTHRTSNSCINNDPSPITSLAVAPPLPPPNAPSKPEHTRNIANTLSFTMQRELVGKYKGMVISPLIIKPPEVVPRLKPIRPAPEIPIPAQRIENKTLDGDDKTNGAIGQYASISSSSCIRQPKRTAPAPPLPLPVDYDTSCAGISRVKSISRIFETNDEPRSLVVVDTKDQRVNFTK